MPDRTWLTGLPSLLDLGASILVTVFVVGGILAYGLRWWWLGRARSARVDAADGQLLGKPVMEAAYWMFEPAIRILLALRATPNQVTAASLLPALLAGIAVAAGHLGVGALVGTGAAFCDLIDGVLARRRGTSSEAGEVFDAAVDRYVEFFLLAGLIVHYRDSVLMLTVTLAALLAAFMVSYASAKAEALQIDPPKGAMRRAERAVYVLCGIGWTPFWQLGVGADAALIVRETPIVIALALLAGVGNVSAARRLYKTAQLVKERAHRAQRLAESPDRGPNAAGVEP